MIYNVGDLIIDNLGQISIEYLLILSAFFLALVFFLPAINFATEKLFESNSIIIARTISNTLSNECSLFSLLGDGSKKSFSFFSTNEILFNSTGTTVVIKSADKEFNFDCISVPFNFSVVNNFEISIKKDNSMIYIQPV